MPECFVIMGFGTKHDPDTGRTLNLDSSYEHIIKPAVEGAGYECIRADEIQHSGVIDRPMYEKLLEADLVVADITTANANAIYELGVRHALRPHSTIVIKEQSGKRYFDLNHLATVSYKHLGEEIGAGEARRKSAELLALIEEKKRAPKDDSPVYEYLRGLTAPALAQPGGRRGLAPPPVPAAAEPSLAELRRDADGALAAADFLRAKKALAALLARGFDDPALVQKLALATLRSGETDEAGVVIERLAPASSTDPETLALAAAIRREQWRLARAPSDLDAAVALYRRAWYIRETFATGDVYASCLELRAESTSDTELAAMDRMSALRVRKRLAEELAPKSEKRVQNEKYQLLRRATGLAAH